MIQILKSIGYSKCNQKILNTLTQIYILYFKKLATQANKYSQIRGISNDVTEKDVLLSFVTNRFIIPNKYLSYDYDSNDWDSDLKICTNPLSLYNVRSLKSFFNWIKYNESLNVVRKFNHLPENLVLNLVNKRKLDFENEGEQDKKKKYKEKQDYYNLHSLNKSILNKNDYNKKNFDCDQNDNIEVKNLINSNFIWINYLIEKSLKFDSDLKFLETILCGEYMKFLDHYMLHSFSKNENTNNNDNSETPNDLTKKNMKLKKTIQSLYKNIHIISDVKDNRKKKKFLSLYNNKDLEKIFNVKPSESLLSILPYNLKYDKCFFENSLKSTS